MSEFSKSSRKKLDTCHADLVRLFEAVIKRRDCTIICGARTLEEQRAAYKGGFSKLDGLVKRSEHQVDYKKPLSTAVDVLPYPILWTDRKGHEEFAVIVKEEAAKLNIEVEWGGNFKKFSDRPHWQLKKKKV